MGCPVVKCKNPNCDNHMQACQLINGYCPSCWTKLQQGARKLVNKCLAFF